MQSRADVRTRDIECINASAVIRSIAPDGGNLASCIARQDAYILLRIPAQIEENPVTTPDVTAMQRSDLNEFLFADVGTEANGMMLSVVSVLARQGSDPWREADRLAELPKAEATDSLARTIADMPRSLWDLPAAVLIAVRLTGLLPTRPARGAKHTAIQWPANRSIVAMACVVLAIAMAGAMFRQLAQPVRPDGMDVASFTSAAPAGAAVPGDHSQQGSHQ